MARPAHGLERRRPSCHASRTSQALRRAQAGRPTARRSTSPSHGSVGLSTSRSATTPRRWSARSEGAVQAAASALRGFASPPGRKVMLLLSGGWPFSLPTTWSRRRPARPSREVPEGEELLRPLASTANLLGYTIYPVDVPGVESGRGGRVGAQGVAGSRRRRRLRASRRSRASLSYVAKETGGKALLNGNRDAALDQAAEDTRSYYWLGFTPTWQRNDKRHKVQASSVRRPASRCARATGFLDLSRKAEISMMVESAMLFGNSAGRRCPCRCKVGDAARSKRGEMEMPHHPRPAGRT